MLAAKLSKVEEFDYNLNDKQHAELLEIVQVISKEGSKDVEELCSKGDEILSKDCNPLREVWQQDVIDRLNFHKDQRKNCMFMNTHVLYTE